jgi:hypothetical protein
MSWLSCSVMAIAVVGLIGDFTTFCLFCKRRHSKMSISVCIRLKMLVDILTLSSSTITVANSSLDIELYQLFWYLNYIEKHSTQILSALSQWILVLMSLDRFLATKRSKGFSFLRENTKSQIFLVFIFLILTSSVYVPLVVSNDTALNEQTKNQTSQKDLSLSLDSSNFEYLLNFVEIGIVLLLINSTLTLLTIRSLIELRRKAQSRIDSLRRKKNIPQSTMTSIALSLINFFGHAPYFLALMIMNFSKCDGFSGTLRVTAVLALLEKACAIFAIYISNRIFYKNILRCFKSPRRAEYFTPTRNRSFSSR